MKELSLDEIKKRKNVFDEKLITSFQIQIPLKNVLIFEQLKYIRVLTLNSCSLNYFNQIKFLKCL